MARSQDNARGGQFPGTRSGDRRSLPFSTGGNDTLIAGSSQTNDLFGDAFEMHNDSRGCDDQLTSHPGSFVNLLYGDAR